MIGYLKRRFAYVVPGSNGLTVGVVSVGLGMVASDASAASLLDSTMTTAVTSGFTDLKDTVVGLIGTAWPYVIGITAILATPGIVKRLISSAAR